MLRLDRQPLTSSDLTADFGLDSPNCANVMVALLEKLENQVNPPTQVVFNAWEEYVSSFCRYDFQNPKKSMITLAEKFQKTRTQCNAVIFCLQTYYSLVLTLLASEILFSRRNNVGDKGYFDLLLSKDFSELGKLLQKVPAACISENTGFKAFSTGNIFWWFADEWSFHLAGYIYQIIRSLNKYQSIFTMRESTETKDLFKELYEDLVPRGVRHDLGEFYTPKWIAEYIVSKIEVKKDTKILDPSCGSGTFIIQAINKIKNQYRSSMKNIELLDLIQNQVAGIDINPIAILTARTNYLLAIADLIPFSIKKLTIPIFMADAINSDSSVSMGSFDYVLGNPPWIGWEHLPETYRKATSHLWKQYNLFSIKSGSEARLGGGKKDLSMLFLHRCIDLYLKERGKLIFLISQSVFQSTKTGEGFREFSIGNNQTFSVDAVDDMVDLKPFRATTRTTVIHCTKGKRTNYPVAYEIWKKNGKIDLTDNALTHEKVKANIVKKRSLAQPSGNKTGSPWIIYSALDKEFPVLIDRLTGQSPYLGKAGVCTWLNGVFWVQILEKYEDGRVLIENLGDIGKKKIKIIRKKIEPDLLFPLIRGRDIGLWNIRPTDNFYILVTNDPLSRKGIALSTMRREYPATYTYLKTFKKELLERPGLQKYFQPKDPYYSIYNVDNALFSPFRLFWPEMGDFRCSITITTEDPFLGEKVLVPNNKVMYLSFSSKEELYFVAGLVNSPMVRKFLSAKKLGTSTTTKLFNQLKLPSFDSRLKTHKSLIEEVANVRKLEGNDKITKSLQDLTRIILLN